MNRFEFMKQLEILLSGILVSEREEALQYYNDYFNDAGSENEKEVIIALGTPAKVAEIIKSGLSGKSGDSYEFTDHGFENGTEKRKNVLTIRNEGTNESTKKQEEKKNMSAGTIILIIVGILLLFPLWIPFVALAFALVVTIVSLAGALGVAVACIGISVLVVGIILFVVGMLKLFVAPLAALLLAGVGMIFTGIGILFILATILFCAKIIPAMVRGFVYVCRLPFRRRETQVG